MSRRPFFYRESHGIRVTVRPTYLPEQSRPHARHYVFAYYVRIENVGQLPAQLLSRRWRLHDSIGEDSEVVEVARVDRQSADARLGAHEVTRSIAGGLRVYGGHRMRSRAASSGGLRQRRASTGRECAERPWRLHPRR